MQKATQNIISLTDYRQDQTVVPPLTLLGQSSLHELVPTGWKDSGAMLGFALGALSLTVGPCLWVRTPVTERDLGQPFGPGLSTFGFDPNRLLIAQAKHDQDVLGIMEEGLSEPALGTIIAALPANSTRYDLVASRRLALRAKEHGVRALLIRIGTGINPSAAQCRWQITARPHRTPTHHHTAPTFTPRWHVALTKSKQRAPGHWHMSWNHETHSICVDALSADGSVDQANEGRA